MATELTVILEDRSGALAGLCSVLGALTSIWLGSDVRNCPAHMLMATLAYRFR